MDRFMSKSIVSMLLLLMVIPAGAMHPERGSAASAASLPSPMTSASSTPSPTLPEGLRSPSYRTRLQNRYALHHNGAVLTVPVSLSGWERPMITWHVENAIQRGIQQELEMLALRLTGHFRLQERVDEALRGVALREQRGVTPSPNTTTAADTEVEELLRGRLVDARNYQEFSQLRGEIASRLGTASPLYALCLQLLEETPK